MVLAILSEGSKFQVLRGQCYYRIWCPWSRLTVPWLKKTIESSDHCYEVILGFDDDSAIPFLRGGVHERP